MRWLKQMIRSLIAPIVVPYITLNPVGEFRRWLKKDCILLIEFRNQEENTGPKGRILLLYFGDHILHKSNMTHLRQHCSYASFMGNMRDVLRRAARWYTSFRTCSCEHASHLQRGDRTGQGSSMAAVFWGLDWSPPILG